MIVRNSATKLQGQQTGPTYAASQTAEVVTADNDASLGVGGVIELIEPVLVLENPAKDTLFVAEQDKCHETADGDTGLEPFSSTKESLHRGKTEVPNN